VAALALLVASLGGAEGADGLRFEDLYRGSGPLGLRFAEAALRLKGRAVTMQGYLAPPLKPEARFLVLSARPVSVCPFCQSDADWPQDIVVVYPRDPGSVPYRSTSTAIEVTGRLELGSTVDPETGFVSQVRLVDAVLRRG
jgi:hypothetical protein